MDKLDELLLIPDEQKRQKALLEHARSLRLSIAKAKNVDGSLSEEKLAILIFDSQKNKRNSRYQNLGFLGIGIFLAAVFGMLVILAMKIVKG